MDIPSHFPAHFPDYSRYDRRSRPVTAMAKDFAPGHRTGLHRHPNAQLIYAVHGVMVVNTEVGIWVVPPTRGVWIPPAMEHELRMVGAVQMRTAYIRPNAAGHLPTQCAVIGVTNLLRELLLAAVEIQGSYDGDSRNGRLMRLLLDEVQQLSTLPLHLPLPTDPRLQAIGAAITGHPHERVTAAQWAAQLGVDPKTVHRLFVRDTGMTFGQWRQQAKLLAALEWLAAGTKVVDVALELGYASPNAFATMFRRQFGMAPSAFFREGPVIINP